MRYSNIKQAIFQKRPNRFIAHVLVDGAEEIVHVKNTGRCRELLVPGCEVYLEAAKNPQRKTAYDLVAVKKEGFGLINMDSQAPNVVVKEWLQTSPEPFGAISVIRPEYVYGTSRIDFYLEYQGKKALLEVKGVTLEREGIAYFPDAPTERGARHLRELAEAIPAGYEAYLAFVIQMEGIHQVCPNWETDPAFAKAYEEAVEKGVRVLFLTCQIEPDGMWIQEAK